MNNELLIVNGVLIHNSLLSIHYSLLFSIVARG